MIKLITRSFIRKKFMAKAWDWASLADVNQASVSPTVSNLITYSIKSPFSTSLSDPKNDNTSTIDPSFISNEATANNGSKVSYQD